MNIQTLKLYVNRPEYIFKPAQIFYHFFQPSSQANSNFKNVNLPWKLKIKISSDTNDVVSKAISKYGIYDLSLTEALWRLTSPGETAIDIGANIGYMTSIMARRVGKAGKVWCFEPNPEVYTELSENIKNWDNNQELHNIYAHQIALSNHSGTGVLNISSKNRGEAFIDDASQSDKQIIIKTFPVALERLDTIFAKVQHLSILKIDVEGHELEVLEGAGELISQHRIRDILFEEHHAYPSQLTQFLESNGYTVFRIWKGFCKPLLLSPNKNLIHQWEPPNYLATIDTSRAIKLFEEWGWKSLYGK